MYTRTPSPSLFQRSGVVHASLISLAWGGGREEQLKSAALLTIPLLWISGAGGAFFWVLGATGVLVRALLCANQAPFAARSI